MNLPYIIAVDFDGTLCENKWPEIGAPNKALIDILNEAHQDGAKIILWTCRTGDLLDQAVMWCADHGLILDAINENLPEVIEEFGQESRKIFANEYIDDRNNNIWCVPYGAYVQTVRVIEGGSAND